jgi:hypothetical protein
MKVVNQSPLNVAVHLSLCILISACFWLNYYHQAEQGTWSRHCAIAGEIVNSMQYSYDSNHGVATYPIWGYPILVAAMKYLFGASFVFWILLFQYFLFLISLFIVYRCCEIPDLDSTLRLFLFYGLLFYYAMILSVKWPDGIVAFLVFLAGLFHIRQKYIHALIMLLISCNFRPEGLFFSAFYLICVFASIRISRPFPIRSLMAIVIACAGILLPWPAYQYCHGGQFLLSSTNGGGVLYISLGQLPNNRWHRAYDDKAAGDYARDHGIEDPFGVPANEILTRQFVQDIERYPVEFIKKIAFNSILCATGGLYSPEFRTSPDDYDANLRLSNIYESTSVAQIASKLFTMHGIMAIFASVFFLVLLVYSVLFFDFRDTAVLPMFSLIFIQIALCAFIQYQPRFMSHVIGLFVLILYMDKKSRKLFPTRRIEIQACV